jgi:hypothetical protein
MRCHRNPAIFRAFSESFGAGVGTGFGADAEVFIKKSLADYEDETLKSLAKGGLFNLIMHLVTQEPKITLV